MPWSPRLHLPALHLIVLGLVLAFDLTQSPAPIVLSFASPLAFHGALSTSLGEHQSDLEELGWFLALPLITAINVWVVALVSSLSLPEAPGFWAFFAMAGHDMARFALSVHSFL